MQSNIEFTTTGGHAIVLKPFVNGYEKWDIEEAFILAKDKPVPLADGTTRPAVFTDQLKATVKKAIETVVLSVDGKTENVYDLVYSLEHNDTAEIKKRVDEVTEIKKK